MFIDTPATQEDTIWSFYLQIIGRKYNTVR